MKLVLIASVARDRAIGKGNELLWRDPEDLKHFRTVTMGCPVLMGRRTWESLPERFRPLPGRRNIVLTRDKGWRPEGAETAASLDEALAGVSDAPKAFVIGGGQLYAQALPRADELVLTEIDAQFEGADTFFPEYRGMFDETGRDARVTAEGIRYDFVTYIHKLRNS
ncbi:MAG TPA: dihydrofolate reductase [Burkholderiaceae bacterium]|nr:dihydrofolate reductase [Burkholderiaceae bacterium]